MCIWPRGEGRRHRTWGAYLPKIVFADPFLSEEACSFLFSSRRRGKRNPTYSTKDIVCGPFSSITMAGSKPHVSVRCLLTSSAFSVLFRVFLVGCLTIYIPSAVIFRMMQCPAEAFCQMLRRYRYTSSVTAELTLGLPSSSFPPVFHANRVNTRNGVIIVSVLLYDCCTSLAPGQT